MKVPGLRLSDEEVGGVVFFGRMLDKIRLHAAGRLPAGYNVGVEDRTSFDARCTRFLGVEFMDVVREVLRGRSDLEVLEWCFAHGRRPPAEEVEIWNEFMRKRGWRDSGSASLVEAKRASGLGDRDDIFTWFDLHRVEESADA